MIGFSFDNRAADASLAPSTTFTEAEAAVGLRHPERPHLRGYSPDLNTHRITLDFGSATALQVFAVIHANCSIASVQGNATDAWGGALGYNPAALTIGRAGNDRYHHAHRPTVAVPFVQRYASLQVPTGVTTDGGVRWAIGGIWAGLITWAPEVLPDPEEEKVEAIEEVRTPDGRVLQPLVVDDAAWSFRGKRAAENEAELAAWRAIDAQWSAAPGRIALVIFRDGAYPEEAYLMRKQTSKWRHGTFWMESDLILDEVTAG